MRVPKRINPGDKEAMDRLRGGPGQLAAERSERLFASYAPWLLLIFFLAVAGGLAYWIYGRISHIAHPYQAVTQDTCLPLSMRPALTGARPCSRVV